MRIPYRRCYIFKILFVSRIIFNSFSREKFINSTLASYLPYHFVEERFKFRFSLLRKFSPFGEVKVNEFFFNFSEVQIAKIDFKITKILCF